MAMEREVKLAAPSAFQLPTMEGVVDGVHPGPLENRDLDASYYDTDELVLARSGSRCATDGRSRRRVDPQTPELAVGAMLVRRELEFAGVATTIRRGTRPDPAYVRSRAQAGGSAAYPTHGAAVARQPGQQLAEIVSDAVTAKRGAGRGASSTRSRWSSQRTSATARGCCAPRSPS